MKIEELKYGEEYYEKTSHRNIVKFKMGLDGNLYWRLNFSNGVWEREKNSLTEILKYRFEKIEEQFPQIGDKYYAISITGEQHLSVVSFKWLGLEGDYRLLSLGNVFKTEEDAKETKRRVIKEILKK